MTTRSLITVNNNLICGMDLETTGLNPNYHEIIQIGLVPLDQNLEPRKDLPPFDFKIKPNYIDRIDLKSLKVSKDTLADVVETGFDSEVVQSQFFSWFARLKLGPERKIVPLGHNIAAFDCQFLRVWLGNTTYESYFHPHPRDTMIVAAYLNDRAEFHAEQTPFPKLTLREMAKKLGVEYIEEHAHDAIYDSYIAACVYRKVLLELLNI